MNDINMYMGKETPLPFKISKTTIFIDVCQTGLTDMIAVKEIPGGTAPSCFSSGGGYSHT